MTLLSGAWAAGWATAGAGTLTAPIVFSLTFNRLPGEAVADRIGVALPGHPRSPSLADIEPRP